MNRAVALRIAACGIMGLGAALLIAALLLSTYTKGKIAKIPLDLDTTLVADGTGTAFDPGVAQHRPKFVINRNVPVAQQEQISVEAPSNADVVTLQVGSTLRRTDKQQDSGLLLALVDTVTLNRKTAIAVSSESNPGGAVQKPRAIDDDLPPTNIALPHDGLAYRFPFDTEKRTYPVFDPIAQKAYDANYDGEEDVNGLTTFRFSQNVGYDADGKLVEPVKYSSLYDDDADAEVTARAALWGLPGNPDEPITMTRYYAAQRTFWVDPVSGTIVKKKEHGYHYYAREPLKPEVTFVDFTVTSTEETVESQVASARDERDRLALWGRILPITFTAIGLVALVGGALLGSFSLRAESALIDPGLDEADHRFFGHRDEAIRVPGAEAKTEKLPASATIGPASGQTRLTARSRPKPARSFVAPAYALVLALLVSAPLLAPGYLLLRDAVSTPRSYLSDAALGLSEAAPRAVPQDFFVALASGAGRRRRGGQGAAGDRAVPGGLGCGAAGGDGAARCRCRRSVGGGDDRHLESVYRRATLAGALEPGGGVRLPAVGGDDDAAAANVGRFAVGGRVRAGVLDGAGRADRDGADAGGDGGGDVRLRAGFRPAAVVVRGGRARRRGAGGAALADRGDGGRFAVVDAGRGCERVRRARRTRPWHVGQPRQPRRDLECRGGTGLAHNAFRGRSGGGAARRGCGGTADGGAPPRRGAAADPCGGGGGGARRDGHRARNGGRRGDDPDAAWPRRGARRAEVGGPCRARLFAGRCGRRRHAAPPDSGRGDSADLLRGTGRDVARSGLGSRRQVGGRGLPTGVGGRRRADQRRPATGRGAARRQHAPLRLGR